MKLKNFIVFNFVLVIALSIVAAVPWWKSQDPCQITEDTNIVFYGDNRFSAVGDLSESWIVHFLEWWKSHDSSINYVELDTTDVQSECDLTADNIKVYIQPGGNAYYQQNYLGPEGKQKLIDYINSGKGYVGICAGFYYTAGDYWWQDEYYAHPDLLGMYPTVEGSIREIADYDKNPGYALTSLSNGFNAIYYGGPTLGYEYTSLNDVVGIVDSEYTEYGNGMPAVIKSRNMLLNSVHLEAYENDGITGLTTEDRIENYKYLANLINEVSVTEFYVPPYTTPIEPYCGDGSCNNGEDYTSCLEDCEAPAICGNGVCEDGETYVNCPMDCEEPTGPIEIFFDGFENGFNWNVYGVGTPWSIKTDAKYEGSYSAGVKKTEVDKLSYIETTIDLTGYSTATLEYYRKLVGLDAADDFSAEYYDGTWHYLEHLGSGRENGDFLYKSHTIPVTATKIRFMCECGAVSEMCYVDNVKVIAE